jgi:hypothetical protein
VAIELLHNAFLAFDDVVDDARHRVGEPRFLGGTGQPVSGALMLDFTLRGAWQSQAETSGVFHMPCRSRNDTTKSFNSPHSVGNQVPRTCARKSLLSRERDGLSHGWSGVAASAFTPA